MFKEFNNLTPEEIINLECFAANKTIPDVIDKYIEILDSIVSPIPSPSAAAASSQTSFQAHQAQLSISNLAPAISAIEMVSNHMNELVLEIVNNENIFADQLFVIKYYNSMLENLQIQYIKGKDLQHKINEISAWSTKQLLDKEYKYCIVDLLVPMELDKLSNQQHKNQNNHYQLN